MKIKQVQDLLTKKMNNAKKMANEAQEISIKGITDFSYYSGLAEGYRKAKEIVGQLKE